jgi:medium-chain acyl-[acyl-carrier-protein] hydrolase
MPAQGTENGRAFLTLASPDHTVARCVCVPFAGGSAGFFRSWRDRLPRVEVLVARLPGRESRMHEPPLRSIGAMARSLREELPTGLGDLPLVLFGHSMGALVAFELARLLARDGIDPLLVVASGCAAPAVSRTTEPLHPLPDRELVARIDERFGMIPPELKSDPEVMELLLPALRADLEAVETYRYESAEPLRCPILVLAGTDEEASEGELAGWSAETTAGVRVERHAGDHFFIRSASAGVLRSIAAAIERALHDRST